MTSKFEQLAHRGGRSAWELSHAITGSTRQAEDVLGTVLTHTLPRLMNSPEEVFRSELLISAGEAASLAVYSPFGNTSATRTNNGARRIRRPQVDPQVLWLESAFRKQLPWYLQTLLWAVEVERLPGPPMEKRLSLPRHSDQRAQEALIRAFMSNASPAAPERACLQRVWAAFRSGRVRRSTARHCATCEWCAAQLETLLNLGEALPRLATPMPDSVWKERWEPVQQSVEEWQAEHLVAPGFHPGGTNKGSSQPGRKGIIVTAALLIGVSLALVLGVRGARLNTALAGGAPQVPLSTSSGGSATVSPAFSGLAAGSTQPTTLRGAEARAASAASVAGGTTVVLAADKSSQNAPDATGGSSGPSGTAPSSGSVGVTSTPSSAPPSTGPSRGGSGATDTVSVGPATAAISSNPSSACGAADVDGEGTGSCLGFAQAPWFLVEMQPGTGSVTSSDPLGGPAPIGLPAPASTGTAPATSQGATTSGADTAQSGDTSPQG